MNKKLRAISMAVDQKKAAIASFAMTAGVYEFDFATTVLGVAGRRFCIDSLFVELTSVATAGNRQLRVGLYETTGNKWLSSFQAGLTQAESLTYSYVFGVGLPLSATLVGSLAYVPWHQLWVSDAEVGATASMRVRFEGGVSAADTLVVGFDYRVEL